MRVLVRQTDGHVAGWNPTLACEPGYSEGIQAKDGTITITRTHPRRKADALFDPDLAKAIKASKGQPVTFHAESGDAAHPLADMVPSGIFDGGDDEDEAAAAYPQPETFAPAPAPVVTLDRIGEITERTQTKKGLLEYAAELGVELDATKTLSELRTAFIEQLRAPRGVAVA